MNARALWLLAPAFVAGPLFAQQPCQPSQQLVQCWSQNETAAKAALQTRFNAALAMQISESREKLLNEPVGVAVGIAETATQNLLPQFSLAGLAAGNGAASNALRGDWNFGLPGAEAHNSQLRLGAIPKPELAQPVVDALAEAPAGVVEDLRGKLGPEDEYSGELTWTLRGYGFGRDIELYRNKQASLLAAVFPPPPPTQQQWQTRFMKTCVLDPTTHRRPPGVPADMLSMTVTQARAVKTFVDNQGACNALVEEVPMQAWAQVEQLQLFQQRIHAAQLDRWADLVNNQPQLTVSLQRTQRDPLVGASFTAVRVGVETGWANLDFFERGAGKVCFKQRDDYSRGREDAIADASCVAAFRRYMEDNETQLDTKDRIAAWVEYAKLEDLELDVPEADLHLKIDGASRIAAGATIGRVLLTQGEGRSTRIDASASYEHFAGDNVRLDHATYSVVLTQKLGYLNIPFVLAYGDRSEFEGGPEGLTTTLGLGFDFGAPSRVPSLPEINVATPLRVVDPVLPLDPP